VKVELTICVVVQMAWYLSMYVARTVEVLSDRT